VQFKPKQLVSCNQFHKKKKVKLQLRKNGGFDSPHKNKENGLNEFQ